MEGCAVAASVESIDHVELRVRSSPEKWLEEEIALYLDGAFNGILESFTDPLRLN